MKSKTISILILSLFSNLAFAQDQEIFSKIEAATGAKGKWFAEESVFKLTFPRTDLNVTARGVQITPPMGLSPWAAFKMLGDHAMVMGDLVLLEDQVNPVMDIALNNGLEVTALHNHFFWDNPKVMFMHVGGTGNAEDLAKKIGLIFSKIKEPVSPAPQQPEIIPADSTLNPANIEKILGIKGELKDGVYKLSIGRKTSMEGHEMGNAMGVNTWSAFTGSNEDAVVDGDFAMLESETQNVLKALRANGIDIVAIHNHMIQETPRIIFLHYWGRGSAESLAKGLKAALDTQS